MIAMDRVPRRALSRRTLMGGVAFGGALLTMEQMKFLRSAAAQEEGVQDILNITATVERFGVTFLGEGLQASADGQFDRPFLPEVAAIVTAARAQEQFHLDFFEQAGGEPLTDTFHAPPATLTSFQAFFTAVVVQETAEVAAQIAAMKTFARLKRPDLAKVSYQYAAEEAEHRLVANYTLGTRPANDQAFAPVLFESAADILADMKTRGIIDGVGTEIVFPGPGEIDSTGVIEREPGGVLVACASGGTPTAGRGTPAP